MACGEMRPRRSSRFREVATLVDDPCTIKTQVSCEVRLKATIRIINPERQLPLGNQGGPFIIKQYIRNLVIRNCSTHRLPHHLTGTNSHPRQVRIPQHVCLCNYRGLQWNRRESACLVAHGLCLTWSSLASSRASPKTRRTWSSVWSATSLPLNRRWQQSWASVPTSTSSMETSPTMPP